MAAAVGLRTATSSTRAASIWPARSYSAVAIKNKQTPSTSSQNSSPSQKADLQPSNSKEKKPRSSQSSLEQLEDNVRAMESMKRFSKMNATTDVWGTEMVNLDADIPYDLRPMFRSLTAKPLLAKSKFSDLWYAIKHNTNNWMKNTYSMFAIAKANAFPGRDVKLRVKTLGRILSVHDSSSDALLAPLRQIALDTYRKVNTSVAKGHEDRVRELTSGHFQEKTVKTMRRREKGQNWTWSIASDVSHSALFPKTKRRRAPTPVDVVSLRAGEVYTENADPAVGHRLLIQALVKFDTTQKIEIFDKRGRVTDSDLAGSRKVVQYLLLEKVGWYDTPWKIKDQFHKE